MESKQLKDLVGINNPQVKNEQSDNTLFSIAGIDHSENALSNVYAYFLDENQPHGLGAIFKESLEQIIFNKTGRKIDLSCSIIDREHTTVGGNRIDILIQGPNHSVIIENKVFHKVNNNLSDYWLSVEGGNETKTGVILTLTHILTNHPNYINVTHMEWLEEIKRRIDANVIVPNSSTKILLEDFFNNIKQLSRKKDESGRRSCIRNRDTINKLYDIVEETREWLQSIFTDKAFIRSLGGYTLVHEEWKGSKNRFAMYRFNGTDEFVATVSYELLWNSVPGEAKLRIYLQPLGNWFDKAKVNEMLIRSIASEEGVPSQDRKADYWHCAAVEINVPESEILSESALKNYLVKYLKNQDSPLLAAARRIIEVLSTTHKPSYQWCDAERKLRELLPEEDGNDGDINFWGSQLKFISFEPKSQIVILEVIDMYYRGCVEYHYYDELLQAIKYAYGNEADCVIKCRIMHN